MSGVLFWAWSDKDINLSAAMLDIQKRALRTKVYDFLYKK
jgi:hypothetical protein